MATTIETSDRQSRREFIGAMSVLTAAATARAEGERGKEEPAETLPNLLPTVALGSLRITRLILGGNPIYGHSHFNRLYSQHLVDYHTTERVIELVRTCTKHGINAWQNSYTERTVQDVQRCRELGLPFHWLLLGKGDWVAEPKRIDEAAAFKPAGIAPHGSSAERLHRAGKMELLKDLLKRIRQTGCLVGLSAHNPQVIEIATQENWDVDYYMCCVYYHNRPKEEFVKLLGEAPMGEVYLESDRQKMLGVIRAANKPCLAYKVLAAGRAELSRAGVQRAFQVALSGMKPTDAMIVGMFQEFDDQVAMNCDIVRSLLTKQT